MGLFTGTDAYGSALKGAMWLRDKQLMEPNTISSDKVGREVNAFLDSTEGQLDKSREDVKQYQEGNITGAEVALRAAGGVGNTFGNAIAGGVSLVTPDWVTKTAGDLMQSGVEATLETKMAQQGLAYLAENPRVARNIEAGVGIAELGLPKALVGSVQRALSAAANYIPNHYTPSIKNLKDMPKEFKSLTNVIHKVGGKTEKESFHAAQKLTGASKWVINGVVGGVNSILNPKARALYDKHGINSSSQKIVKSEMALYAEATKKGEHKLAARHKEKAVAQVNYNKYITAQTGYKGDVAKVMDDVLEAVSYDGMQKLTKQNYINSAKKQKSTLTTRGLRGKITKSNLEATDADLGYVFEQAQKLWKMPAKEGNKMVVKRNTGVGGNHGSDAITNKNKVHNYARKLFKEEGISDPMEIYNHLKAVQADDKLRLATNPDAIPKFPKGVIMLNKGAEDVAVNGLWLSSSHVGSAVVEGGVNVMTKIMPDQRAMSFVTDVHDFLEKTPVLGKVLAKALPNNEMSLTPPIYSDMRLPSVKAATAEKAGTKATMDSNQTGKVSDETIAQYINAKPSIGGIAAQGVKMPLSAAVIGNGLFDYNSERERYWQ